MWGREMRAGIAFVILALLIGQGFREWKRSHQESFRELVEELTAKDAASRAHALVGQADSSMGTTPAGTRAGRGDASSRRSGGAPLGRIDVNRASETELTRLPGIGPKLAARIVSERDRAGAFASPEALLRVPGIGPKTLARIQGYLSFPRMAGGDAPARSDPAP